MKSAISDYVFNVVGSEQWWRTYKISFLKKSSLRLACRAKKLIVSIVSRFVKVFTDSLIKQNMIRLQIMNTTVLVPVVISITYCQFSSFMFPMYVYTRFISKTRITLCHSLISEVSLNLTIDGMVTLLHIHIFRGSMLNPQWQCHRTRTGSDPLAIRTITLPMRTGNRLRICPYQKIKRCPRTTVARFHLPWYTVQQKGIALQYKRQEHFSITEINRVNYFYFPKIKKIMVSLSSIRLYDSPVNGCLQNCQGQQTNHKLDWNIGNGHGIPYCPVN